MNDSTPERERCPECGEEIDSDYCWCGDPTTKHSIVSGHTPVPMGCKCHYAYEEKEKKDE
jgi:hypothetical protein